MTRTQFRDTQTKSRTPFLVFYVIAILTSASAVFWPDKWLETMIIALMIWTVTTVALITRALDERASRQ